MEFKFTSNHDADGNAALSFTGCITRSDLAPLIVTGTLDNLMQTFADANNVPASEYLYALSFVFKHFEASVQAPLSTS